MEMSPASPKAQVRKAAWAYVAQGVALWPVPLLGMLHAEGAAVTAFASFFIAGVSSVGAFGRGEARVAARHLALLVIPWALLTITTLWRPNCGYLQGLGLFALLVPPASLLAVGLAETLVAYTVRRPRAMLVGIGLALAVVPTLLVLKWRPQLFVYNPIFGGILGPIYDAELAVRPGLFAHQAAVLVGAVGLTALARWRRQPAARWGRLAVGCGGVLVAVAAFSVPLGITQSEANLRRHLSQTKTTDRVRIHVAPGRYPSARLEEIADEAEFRLWQTERALGIAPRQPVHVYLYPDPETKAALLGSRNTSVVPVWLPGPQIHMLEERVEGDLGHELVHVVAREVGGALTGATTKVGLVEGLAVALEPPDGLPSPEQQAAASLAIPPDLGGLADPALSIVGAMDPLGFWTGRAGVSYSTTGAFTRWLLDTYGPEPVLSVYGGASWREAFRQPLGGLAEAWAEHLRSVPVTPEATDYTRWRFGLPSLFEVRCPHHVTRWQRHLRDGNEAWASGNTDSASRLWAEAATATDDSLARAIPLANLALADAMQGRPPSMNRARALLRADSARVLWGPRLALAHAAALSGASAGPLYADAIATLPPYAIAQREIAGLQARLTSAELRAALVPTQDSTALVGLADVLSRGSEPALVFAALRYAEAGVPRKAWSVLQPMGASGLAERPAILHLAGRLAYHAGHVDAAQAIASRMLTLNPASPLAALAEDLGERAQWHLGRGVSNTP